MEKENYIDQLNQERIEKINKKIIILRKQLKNAKTAYNKAIKNEEKKINLIKEGKNTYEYIVKKNNIRHNTSVKRDQLINIDNKLIELKIKKESLEKNKSYTHKIKVESLTDDLINHLGGNYKEKTISTPHESGRKELSTRHKDSLSEVWNAHNTDDETIEYTQKSEVEGAFGETSHDAEQEIYDTIDYNLGNTEDISPALLEALKFYEEHEEPNDIKNKSQKVKKTKAEGDEKTNQYEDYDEEFYSKRKNNKLNKKELKKQKLEKQYRDIENEYSNKPRRKNQKEKEIKGDYYGGRKQAKQWRNTKHRNAKSKIKHKRSHKTEKKGQNTTQKDIEKYGFAA